MRKITRLLLAAVVFVVVIGMMGASTTQAALPPSSGSPTPIWGCASSTTCYGSIVLGNTFKPSGTQPRLLVYIFSTSGPFYVEKINIMLAWGSPNTPILLGSVFYDWMCSGCINWPYYPTPSPTIIPTGHYSGEIIAVAPSTIHDPTGASAIPASNAVAFLMYRSKFQSQSLFFEATVLAPTGSIVSICASDSVVLLSSCNTG